MPNKLYKIIRFKGVPLHVGIVLKTKGFDIELFDSHGLSLSDIKVFKKYLEDEGYIDMARDTLKENSN